MIANNPRLLKLAVVVGLEFLKLPRSNEVYGLPRSNDFISVSMLFFMVIPSTFVNGHGPLRLAALITVFWVFKLKSTYVRYVVTTLTFK